MSAVLLVPIRIDVLCLAQGESVVAPMVDFSLLPYTSGGHDVQADRLYLGGEITSDPLEDRNLHLAAGVHLHWALPDALTRAVDHQFPAVPNRWLVTRARGAAVDRRWIVESNYLHPPGRPGGTGVTFPMQPTDGDGQPFRYLGRKLALDAGSALPAAEDGTDYLEELTAVGYGEPTFAAFYPNCWSVFGLHDASPPDSLDDVAYEVLGWYSDPAKDPLQSRRFQDALAEAQLSSPTADPRTLHERALADAYGWAISGQAPADAAGAPAADAEAELPSRIICYARLAMRPSSTEPNPDLRSTEVDIAVGNTASEALAAYLAHTSGDATPSNLEDRLEWLNLAAGLEGRMLDIGPRFQEARHERAFTAVPAGMVWTIRSTAPPGSPADATQRDPGLTLPPELAHPLNEINVLQQEYDTARFEIESLRRRIYSDWCKYLVCIYQPALDRGDYPDGDDVKLFIERRGLDVVRRLIARTGTLRLRRGDDGQVVGAVDPHAITALAGGGASVAARLAQEIRNLLALLPRFEGKGEHLLLQHVPAPRFWRPNEPVVLLAGPAVRASERHGQDGRLRDDGLLDCHTLDLPNDDIPRQAERIGAAITSLAPVEGEERIGFDTCAHRPWHPFLLEWQVELYPTRAKSNVGTKDRSFEPDFIAESYQLDENAVDLSYRPGKDDQIKARNIYSGRSILTPHARLQLVKKIEEHLAKQFLDAYYAAHPAIVRGYNHLHTNLEAILAWAKGQDWAIKHPDQYDFAEEILRVYDRIGPDLECVAQALSGFNEALLGHRQAYQLPIDDPLGFPAYRQFAQAVRNAVGNANRSAPVPANDFNPIRTGVLRPSEMRVVDTFGQVLDLRWSRLYATEVFTVPDSQLLIHLPPRLVQPARLDLRWLAAPADGRPDEMEMNDHPATSPICGWLLPNNFDGSLMVYDQQGRALGSIDRNGRWQAAPGGSASAERPEQIPGPLGTVVRKILEPGQRAPERGRALVAAFISALDSALENIDPESAAHHQDLALLIGRPLAVVRVALGLELQGLPAVNQDWNAFRQDLVAVDRDTDGFMDVAFPIRIGEYRQLNDGVAGYWLEGADGHLSDVCFSPQSNQVGDDLIRTHDPDLGPVTLSASLADERQVLTVLLDPRGALHATTGILPTKAISIPPDQYAGALRTIQVTFLSTPILTPRGQALAEQIGLPLPNEPGYAWSWLEQTAAGSWDRARTIVPVGAQSSFAAGQEIREGWLVLGKTSDASQSEVPADGDVETPT